MEQLLVTARDGARLVCWDFAGQGKPLFMVHGTGLHGRCWGPVAAPLSAAGFRPLALDMRGHGSSSRSPDGDYSWDLFALDVLDTLAQLGLSNGVAAVGHSAGGAALLLAEESRPGTFSRIWAWEPIIGIPGSDERARRGAGLARRARQRRAHFASVDEARAHFQGRHMFAEFSPEALEAFLDGGLVPDDGGGYRLACDPEDEARIYEGAAAHSAWDGLGRIQCPTRLLGGELSPAVPPDELATIVAELGAQRPGGPGGATATATATIVPMLGHFGPFQRPADIADDIANWAK
jgi:pimeloyl-ACP methyl ester carboxylesterase